MKKKLLFLIANDFAFCTHRFNLGKAALAAGFEVAIATRCEKHADLIEKIGATGIYDESVEKIFREHVESFHKNFRG